MFHAVMTPGIDIARGVARMLLSAGYAPITEFVPARGLRADICALGPSGDIWIVECKSGVADFRADRKWTGYLDWCDRFFWAVDADFPADLLPAETGLIRADAWGGEMLRDAPEHKLAPARRRALTLRFARNGAERLLKARDPDALIQG
ncbi:MAG: MmcB family DNA repair protein [Pseudomonadota bacterium]